MVQKPWMNFWKLNIKCLIDFLMFWILECAFFLISENFILFKESYMWTHIVWSLNGCGVRSVHEILGSKIQEKEIKIRRAAYVFFCWVYFLWLEKISSAGFKKDYQCCSLVCGSVSGPVPGFMEIRLNIGIKRISESVKNGYW